VSATIELAGLSSIATGVWLQWGQAVGLMAAGVAALVYAIGLDRSET